MKNTFKTIIQLFSAIILFNIIAQREPIVPRVHFLLYIFKEVHFYFCLHLSAIFLVTSFAVLIARKKASNLWDFANKIMWITLFVVMFIHCAGIILEI